jgi:hypothetical protein
MAQDCLLVFFEKFLLGQKPMLVRIKGSRLFAGFFSKVLTRSKTNACPDQGLKIVCWFFFYLFFPNQEHLDDYNIIYFSP